ncbi:MAG: hypothetical protein V4628_13805 [Pseudomonadota bacterium]
MTRQNSARHSLFFCLINLLAVSFPFAAQAESEDILSNLPYDQNFIQEKINQFTVTAHAPDTDLKVPAYLLYKLAFRKLLADESLQAQIALQDLELIKKLPAPSDSSFLAKDRKEITAICIQTNNIETPAEIQDVAVRYDDSRERKERDLDAFYDNALASLSAETRTLIQNLLFDISARKQVPYATFDMAGFAQAVPDAAKLLLIAGCESFSADVIAYTPQTVTMGDLKPAN